MTRSRRARRTATALLALLVPGLVACTSTWDTVPPLELKGRPPVVDASRFVTRFPIKHVVFIIKENRTFDQMFGRFPGADGATVGLDRGVERALTRTPDPLPEDIKHC